MKWCPAPVYSWDMKGDSQSYEATQRHAFPEDRAAALQAKYIQVFGAPVKANSRSRFGKSEFEIFSLYQTSKLTYSAETGQ